MTKLISAVAVLLCGAAVLGTGAAQAGGPQSALLPITLPAGSTSKTSGYWEVWKTTTPHSYNVKMLRAQLPIGRPFLGIPWCRGAPLGTMQQWDWNSGAKTIVVAATDDGDVSIFAGPDDSGRGDCD